MPALAAVLQSFVCSRQATPATILQPANLPYNHKTFFWVAERLQQSLLRSAGVHVMAML